MLFSAIENTDDRLKVERLYDKYRKLMYKVAYDILHEHTLAEDAVYESFIRIIKNLHKIDEDNCPRTRSFLSLICRNVAIDMLKSRTYLNTNEELTEEMPDTTAEPSQIVINNETKERISKAITALPEIYRDVFLLRYAYNYSRTEISEILNISVETVKKRLSRAKQKLVDVMEKEELR